MNRGRPSVKLQIEIQNKIENCFFKGYSAHNTSEQLDLDPKTVQKYFNKFLDDYTNIFQSKSDSEKQAMEYKIKTEIFLENLSDNLLSLLNKNQTQLNNLKLTNKTFKIYKFLSDSILKITSTLADIQILRTNNHLYLSEGELRSIQQKVLSN